MNSLKSALKFAFILMITEFLASCASISTNPTAYVAGTETFEATEFSYKTSFSKGATVAWKNYELVTGRTENSITQKTAFGIGKKSGALIQHGTFYKDGKELYKATISRRIDGWVNEDVDFDTGDVKRSGTIYDEIVTIETGKNGTVFYIVKNKENSILRDSSIADINISKVTSYINEHGKIYDMWMNYSMGAKVLVGNEIYAIVDYMHTPKQIKMNPDFSQELSEEAEDLLAVLMMEIYHYEQHFSSEEIEAKSKFGVL